MNLAFTAISFSEQTPVCGAYLTHKEFIELLDRSNKLLGLSDRVRVPLVGSGQRYYVRVPQSFRLDMGLRGFATVKVAGDLKVHVDWPEG